MMSKSFLRMALLGIVELFAFGSVVQADTIIYLDTFTRSGSLNGSAPDVTLGSYGGTAGATWISPTNWTTNGTQATMTTTNGGASLPFVPQTGQVYTLSVVENCTAPSYDWIGLGYSTANGGVASAGYHVQVTPSAWMLMRGDTSTYPNASFYSGPTVYGGLDHSANIGTNTGQNTISMVLDTNPTLWTIQWYVNSTPVRSATFNSQNPSITTVSFGSDTSDAYAPGYVDNFTLSVATIPEPASLGMGLLGLGIIALGRRRTTRQSV